MKIRITRLSMIERKDENFSNLKVGSTHDTIPAPESIKPSSSPGVWVQGSISPTKLFPDEYEIVEDQR